MRVKPNGLDFKRPSKQVFPVTLCPPRLLKFLGFPVICAAMFVVLGGHWAVLQAVAWSQMVVSYSENTGSVTEGIKKTFSGQYPCAMCKKIAEAKGQQEQKPAAFKAEKKVESFVAHLTTSLRALGGEKFFYPVTADSRFPSRSDQPPGPVPIIA